ncbi:MAG: MMPL family transporter [Actinomycetales bacterium]
MNTVQINSAPRPSAAAGHTPPTARGAAPAERLRGFERLGAIVERRRRLVLAVFVLLLALAGALGTRVFPALQTQGYDDPGSQSAQAGQLLRSQFGVRDPLAVLAVEATGTGVDAPGTAAAATRLASQLQQRPDVAQVVSYWTSGHPASLRGTDGRTGEVLVWGKPGVDEEKVAADLVSTVGGAHEGLRVSVGGFAAVSHAINDQVTKDLARAESISVPLTLVLLLVVFGTVVAAGLPFVVAAGAILGSFFLLWVVSTLTDVSVFALNLVTGLGLGLGIDYALLVVNRFREELAAGLPVPLAVQRTVATAGRTVAYSGVTVAIVLAALSFFPQYFLRSFAYAGVSVTLLAVIATTTALPAVLAMLGHRVDRLRIGRRQLAPRDTGAWSRIATVVMRRPVPVLLGVLVVMLTLAAPALSANFGQVDARALPSTNPAAAATALLADRFPGREATPVEIVLPQGVGATSANSDYASRLSQLPHIVRVSGSTGTYVDGARVAGPPPGRWTADGATRFSAVADVEPRSSDGEQLVSAVRAVPAPGPTLVGGAAAEFADSQSALSHRGVLALLWIAVATLLVLFLYTGSVVLPLKALLLNVISLSTTLGVLVWVFQEGHLAALLGGFTVTGTVDTSMAILVAITAFALSMDYEVFLLSRIKEEHDRGQDTQAAVTLGLQRSGRIITAAAVLLAIVFAAFVSSGVTNIKQLGLGVAFAILIDATVVRGLLVPAFMRLAGRWNWWAPRPLASLHARFGLSEG